MGISELDNLLDEALGAQDDSLKSTHDDRPFLMVVDDDNRVCEALEVVLADRFNVSSYNDPKSALDALDESIHVVLLDIKMETMDGFACFEQMRARFTHLPIIFHSAYQDLKDPYEVMNTFKPFGYLQKGAKESELVSLLERAVDYRKKFRESERKLRALMLQNEELQKRILEREDHIREQKAALGSMLKQDSMIPHRKMSQPPSTSLQGGEPHEADVKGQRLYGIGSIVLRLGSVLEDCRKDKRPLFCCVVEVDSFETLRRREGMGKSEDIVEHLVTTLSSALGGQVLVGRIGDAKVAFIAPGVGPTSIEMVRQEMKGRISSVLQPEGKDDQPAKTTVSSGSVCLPAGTGTDARRLIQIAERALENARRRGPGSWVSEIVGADGRDGVR
ncbi:MAG: response regulator [Myxococcota bacterium]|nr:response regulator [Myxococcota bacterium]